MRVLVPCFYNFPNVSYHSFHFWPDNFREPAGGALEPFYVCWIYHWWSFKPFTSAPNFWLLGPRHGYENGNFCFPLPVGGNIEQIYDFSGPKSDFLFFQTWVKSLWIFWTWEVEKKTVNEKQHRKTWMLARRKTESESLTFCQKLLSGQSFLNDTPIRSQWQSQMLVFSLTSN